MPDFLKTNEKQSVSADTGFEAPKVAPATPETAVIPTPEATQEKQAEQESNQPERMQDPQPAEPPQQVVPSHVSPLKERVATPTTKSERLIEIEKIMSEGLADIYQGLDSATQQRVKTEGEEAANKIEKLIEEGKAAGKKVLHILRDWLKKIPGVNKYFLEQESKIKTDDIMSMARKTRGDSLE